MPPSSDDADAFMNLARAVFELGFPFRIYRLGSLQIEVLCPNAACFEATLSLAKERNMLVGGVDGGLRLTPMGGSQPATNFP
jgi:hypothetical protein